MFVVLLGRSCLLLMNDSFLCGSFVRAFFAAASGEKKKAKNLGRGRMGKKPTKNHQKRALKNKSKDGCVCVVSLCCCGDRGVIRRAQQAQKERGAEWGLKEERRKKGIVQKAKECCWLLLEGCSCSFVGVMAWLFTRP